MHHLSQGVEVYSHDSTSLGIIDYLRKNEVGIELVAKINDTFRNNGVMTVNSPLSRNRRPIGKGHILYEASVSAALDQLGIRDIQTATLEQAIGFMRSVPYYVMSIFPIGRGAITFVIPMPHYHLVSDIGMLITGLGTHEHVRNLDMYISRLLEQAKIKKMDLPAVLFHLRAYPDSRFPYDVRLDYTENSSWMPAPALVGEPFRTTKNQSLNELLVDGRNNGIELFGRDSDDVKDPKSWDLQVWTGASGDFVPLTVVCSRGGIFSSDDLGAMPNLSLPEKRTRGRRILLQTAKN